MARVTIDESILYDIADAIRYAEKSSGEISVVDFANRIKVLGGIDLDPVTPVVPSGTWQLKTTSRKKYVIMGTDDDNIGNAKYFRLLRSYNFPYTMNVEAENANSSRDMGNDLGSEFTDTDAPSIFPNGVDIITLGKYIHENNLGEIAQHGSSKNTLWDSENLTGSNWDTLYSYYTSMGGTKTEEELRNAISELMADTDGSQDALYVERSRELLEKAFGFPMLTVGSWGGSPSCTVDNVELNLNSFKGTSNYSWREHNYFAVSSRVATFANNDTCYDISRMNDGPDVIDNYLNDLRYGKAIEFFWHMPFNDNPFDDYRALFERLKANTEVEVITRYQYSQLGEYVDNPIKSISVSRSGNLNVGDSDSDTAYTITVTYEDNTTSLASEDAILDRSRVNTESGGTYTVYAYYRGFYATCNVIITSANYTVPEGLKTEDNWFIYSNDSNGNWYCGNYSKGIAEAKKSPTSSTLLFTASEASGKLNGWKSADKGVTWEQVTTNKTTYNTNLATNKTSDTDGGYQFDSKYNDSITWIETSGNFVLNY